MSIFDWLSACCSEQPSSNLDYRLRPREEIIIGYLQQEVLVPFEPGALEHEAYLQEYFKAAAPALSPLEKDRSRIERLPEGRRDHRWKELGFQDEDPRTDFRGGGLLSLKCLFASQAYQFAHNCCLNTCACSKKLQSDVCVCVTLCTKEFVTHTCSTYHDDLI
ncbi:elmoB [Symbiodinium pilosum]|uniref:ElmoB protein n=1 Tax=Symbiodinium pilosum TaxID=2952 RepID=A0A812MQH3_SYMPI|nr:elmoB [Symbiodinium pilosum]